MNRILFSKKGQSILEYAVLISAIALVLGGIHVYGKRAMTGNLKSASDDIGEQYSIDSGTAYSKTTTYNKSAETRGDGEAVTDIETQTRERLSVVKTPAVDSTAAVTAATESDLPASGWGKPE